MGLLHNFKNNFSLKIAILLSHSSHMVALVIIQRRLLILIPESIKAIKLKNGYEFESVVQGFGV